MLLIPIYCEEKKRRFQYHGCLVAKTGILPRSQI